MKIANPLFVVAYVVLSSLLGLGGVLTLLGDASMVPVIFAFAWVAQPAADVVFVIGSAVVAVVAYRVSRLSPWLALITAAAGSCLVYGFSATVLSATFPPDRGDGTYPATNFGVAIFLGGVGITFATVAPVLLWLRRSRSATGARRAPINPEPNPAPAFDAAADHGQVRPLVLDGDVAVGKHVPKLDGDGLSDVPGRE